MPMGPKVSDALAKYFNLLFGSEEDSDCTIVFCLEADACAERSASDAALEERPAKRPCLEDDLNRCPHQEGTRRDWIVLGEPLPAHKVALRGCSERFAAELRRWREGKDASADQGASAAGAGSSGRPVLRVPLGSEAEVPSARAAIRFVYTGDVAAGNVREALEVRRQAGYLRIDGCAAACDHRIQTLMTVVVHGPQEQQLQPQQGVEAASAAICCGRKPHLLEFFDCSALWPDACEEPGFTSVLEAAKQRLVAHFVDALKAINDPVLCDQLLKLPAAALEALLESDDFGTDSESSVFLMLALWMRRNHGATDAETRARLCRRVRLVQLSRAYLTSILPALAADYEVTALLPQTATPSAPQAEPQGPNGWFPISVTEAVFVARMAEATEDEAEALKERAGGIYDLQSPWYCTRQRRQCLPADGRVFAWRVPQQAVELAQKEVKETGKDRGLRAADGVDWDDYYADGLVWAPDVYVTDGGSGGELVMFCFLPEVYDADSVVGTKRKIVTASGINACLSIHYWQDGICQAESHRFAAYAAVGGAGLSAELRRLVPLAAGLDGGRPVDAWGAYLRDGWLSGTFALLPPTAAGA